MNPNWTIKKSGWIYKLTNLFCHHSPSENFCLYFWQSFRAILCSSLLLFIFLFFFMSPVWGSFAWLLGYGFPELSAATATAYLIFLVVLALFHLTAYCKEKFESGPEREPSLILGYIATKKQKICPKITFID